MKTGDMPTGGLYELINGFRIDALLEAEQKRRSSFSGALSELRDELPKIEITRGQAAALWEKYDVQQQAGEIVRMLMPEKI